MATFPTFFGNIARENVFCDILERKNDFLSYKNKKLKKWRNWDFSQRIDPFFWSKNSHFSTFFFGNIGKEYVLRYSKTKIAYPEYKKKLKRSKNWDFLKRG